MQAKKLSEAGFDWKTHHYYDDEGDTIIEDCSNNYNSPIQESFGRISAPTVALALKWFIDEKGFDYSIIKGRLPYEYSYILLNDTQGRFHINGYEAAESALLDELLELILNEK